MKFPRSWNLETREVQETAVNNSLGLSTVPYTTAVLLTVVIRSCALPYVNCIHEFESPRRYGTVIITAGIRVKTAVRVTSAS